MELTSFYLPDIFNGHYNTGAVEIDCPGSDECMETGRNRNGAEHIKIAAHELKDSFFTEGLPRFYENASAVLASLKIKDIIDTLDCVSRQFLDTGDPDRKTAIEAIRAITGFSRESAARSIELEFSSSLKPEMTAAIINEFGSLEILDEFVSNARNHRRSRALPAGAVFAVSSSNIPALPHLSIMRAFLTKNPVVVKTSFDEPVFTPLYMQAFRRIKSPLSECAAAVCYKSGENAGYTDKFIDWANVIIAYGGIEAEKYFAGRIKYPKKLIMHPHRLGFGIIAGGALKDKTPAQLDELAHAIAADTATFDQRACLAPHIYFYCLEDNENITDFMARLMRAFEYYEQKLPPATLSGADNFSRRSFLDSLNFEKGVSGIYETISKKSAVIDITPSKFILSPLNRVLFIARFHKAEEVLNIIKPLGKYLQNAALCAKKDDENFWFDALSKSGVSRICAPGEMPAPTMMWRHDGIGALIEMTKFCDIEKYD